MAPKSKEVAKVPEKGPSAIEEINDPAMLAELEGVAGAGLSDNIEDRGTPLLYIAQKGSKQVNKKEPLYIDGLEVGDAFNQLTGEIFKAEAEGVPFLPCFFRVNWNEWTPQDQGGGFHGSHPRDTPLVQKGRQREGRRDIIDMPDGHELILTHHYYGVIPDTMTPMIVPMSSTNLSASQKMQGLINAQKISAGGKILVKPAFWNVFNLKTIYDKNDAGDWYRWMPSISAPNVDPDLREFCKAFALACMQNAVKMSAPVGDQTGDGEDLPV